MNARTQATTGQYITLVEVKNVRSWIYPQASELHQLLDKAATLQMQLPDLAFLPVLVCRQAHPTTNYMAHHLGFYAISTKEQYVPASLADSTELAEVVAELGYQLAPVPPEPPPALVRHFSVTLQSVAPRTAERWRTTAQHLTRYFKHLRDPKVKRQNRINMLQALRDDAVRVHGDPEHCMVEVRRALDSGQAGALVSR